MSAQKELENGKAQATKSSRLICAALSLIGFTAVIAQTILMRELIVVFYGNEISLGILLANWLFWTAVGSSLLGRWVGRARDARRLMAGLEVLIAAAFPLTILAVRSSKLAVHSIPGEILGTAPMFLTSFVALSVFCAISGCLFAAGSRLYAEEARTATAPATGAVYLLEALGSGLGGILASIILIRFLTAFAIASLVGVANLLAAISLGIREARYRRALFAVLVAALFLLPSLNRALESVSLATLWRGFRLVETRNSVYGNLAVVETGQSRSLFENGLAVLTVPDPAAAEEAVHFALLEHPAPKSLLLIGGGVNGSLAQALQHPSLKRVDYVELDPTILELAARDFPQAWAAPRADPRVRIHLVDGRLFLKTTSGSFDVIIVNLPDPHTAQLNRFYTQEFFSEAAQKLNSGGIFSFQVTAAENYISQELADFLRCLLKTLRAVFPEVAAIPGETVHFFAASRAGTLTTDSSELLSRLRARQVHTRYVREYYLPFRLAPDRMLDLQLQIEPVPTTPRNRDFAPMAYYFDVVLWSARFHRGTHPWFESLAQVKFGTLAGGAALVLFACVGLVRGWLARAGARQGARPRAAAGFCVAAMGFTLLGLEVLLLLGFQALYGYVYHQLVILIALFMVGMAMGAWLASPGVRLSWRAAPPAGSSQVGVATGGEMRTLVALQALAAISPALLVGLLELLGRLRNPSALFLVSQVLFPALALLAGLLGGYQFPLASRIFFAGSADAPRSPGTLYALDLVGACLGAVALSAYLVPVYGFLRTALLMAVVDLAPAVLAGLSVPESAAPRE
jgi:spermidine synthase